MELSEYVGKDAKDPVVQKQEYGTYVERDKKKKKKKKNKRENDNKEIDEEKIKQIAKESQLYKIDSLTADEKVQFSEAENHPLKYVCLNLPLKITSEQIISYFNTLIGTTYPDWVNPPPIKDISFDRARTFAIMSLSSRKIKDFFSKFTQFQFSGGKTSFKVVRARAYFEEKYLKKKESGLDNAGSDNKIYLGGLPLGLVDDQVRRICQTFGKLKFFNLVKDGAASKGYAFFQFQDGNNSEKAIKALNGLPIVDKKLKCHHATLGNKGLSLAFTPAVANNVGLQEVQTKPSNHTLGSFLLSYDNINDILIQQTLKSQPLCKISSRVVQFLNMCYPEDLYDEIFFEDLNKDIEEECAKFGPVEQIIIPRPDPRCGYSVPSVGKVFVKFMYIIHAKRARAGLAGRVYNKRTVVTSFYPEEKFNLKEYLVAI